MKYTIAQITSSQSLASQYRMLARQSSFESWSLEETMLKCHDLNQSWMQQHYKNDGVVLIHVPAEIWE